MKKVFLFLLLTILCACTKLTKTETATLQSIDDGNILAGILTVKLSNGQEEKYITFSRSWSKEFFDIAKNAALFTPAMAVRRPDQINLNSPGNGGTSNITNNVSSEANSSASAGSISQ